MGSSVGALGSFIAPKRDGATSRDAVNTVNAVVTLVAMCSPLTAPHRNVKTRSIVSMIVTDSSNGMTGLSVSPAPIQRATSSAS